MLAKRWGHSGSSARWLARQQRDPYAKGKARLPHKSLDHVDAFASRAAYKLLEIQQKYRIFSPRTKVVVDLGAAPGSWVQAARLVAPRARMVALDLLPLDPAVAMLPNVTVLQGDFLSGEVQAQLAAWLDGRLADVVVSDMLANVTGIPDADVQASLDLCESALAFSASYLAPNGSLVMKHLVSPELQRLGKESLKARFASVDVFKPKSSRPESREAFFVCRNPARV